jgi:ferredoxin
MLSKKMVLHFPRNLVNQPIVENLIRNYDLSFNILKAQILPDEEGLMVLEIKGEPENYDAGIEYLKESGVSIQPLSKDIKRDEDKCTHCGACIAMCPVKALTIDDDTRMVNFDSDKCIGCELCIDPCPTRAMELHF